MDNSPQFVIAVGASAGGLLPLQELIEHLPDDLARACIVIAQHLSPEYKSMLPEIISRKTRFKTESIVDGVSLQVNHIYVTPPNCDAIFNGNTLEIVETTVGGPRPNIDRLFESLAREHKDRAVGIILSGTGHDGSNGILAIKRVGGITICQDPETAKYTGMPHAALATQKIDFVMSASEIGSELVNILGNNYDGKIHSAEDEKEEIEISEPADDIAAVLALLEKKLGTNFADYKSSTILRRISKRLKDTGIPTLNKYLEHVKDNEEELEAFFGYMLIGVTAFFRDSEAFKKLGESLKEAVIKKAPNSTIRIWVPGCATGEESVTLAIIVNEIFRELNRFDIKLQIFATDVNMNALKTARRGIYPKAKVEVIDKKIVERYFTRLEDKYETTLDIRNSIIYTPHDLTSNPPFLRLDLISCRNLFIYFKQDLQNKLFPVFHYSLNPGGILFMGKSESIGNYKMYFNAADARHRIFTRKGVGNKKPIRLPGSKFQPVEKLSMTKEGPAVMNYTVQDMIKETLYTHYDNPYVIIDEHSDIIEISGDINPFVSIKAGVANISLLKLVREEFHLELRALVSEAVKQKAVVTGRLRQAEEKNDKKLLRITVRPLQFSKPGSPYFMVVFDLLDIDIPYLNNEHDGQWAAKDEKRIKELEYELASNRQHMNTLVEELENSNEELQALNEELQSSNEEMQASNEELETSNEELQATNEELENAYMDMRTMTNTLSRQKQMLEQITHASPDLIALLRGEQFIFEFLNPGYQALFKDKKLSGESLLTVFPEMVQQGFFDILNKVRNTRKGFISEEMPFEFDFAGNGSPQTKYFKFSFTPLVSSEGKDVDVVVYAIDITTTVEKKRDAEYKERFLRTLAGALPQKVWTMSVDGNITYANEALKEYLGGTMPTHIEQVLRRMENSDAAKYKTLFSDSGREAKPFRFNLRFREPGNAAKYRWHLFDQRPLVDTMADVQLMVCTAIDIQEEKDIEKRKDEFMSITSHELKTPLTTVQGYVDLLEEVLTGKDYDKALVYTARTDKALKKVVTLVNDLLDITRIETGKFRFQKNNISFDEIVDNTIDEFRPLAEKHFIKYDGNKTGVIIHADELRIAQVLTNILSNAVKYSPPDTDIEVKKYTTDKTGVIQITDHGIGISSSMSEKIFERFFRIDNTSHFNGGLGIGLYISREIAERHDATLTATGKPGQGSTFTLSIPIVK